MVKKLFILIWAMMLSSIMLSSCTKDEDANNGEERGSIYGIVTELGTSEPMKAVGVELYKSGNLLLKTVTFDDGHFEFKDLIPENYYVRVVGKEYESAEKAVTVESGRQARIDLQLRSTTGIYGVVTLAETDTPVANAEIVLFKSSSSSPDVIYAKVYSDENGNYNINHVEPLNGHSRDYYFIRAQKDNYSTIDYEIRVVKSGERLQVNLLLSKKEE